MRVVSVSLASLVIAISLACGGGGGDIPDIGSIAPPTDGGEIPATGPGTPTPPVTPPAPGGGLGSGDPLYGTHNLSGGFTPDPKLVTVAAGGDTAVAAAGLPGNCVGFIAPAQPDVRLDLSNFPGSLKVASCADSDTALAIRTPSGNWLCNDDTEGRNPVIELARPTGRYDVWVATYSAGGTAPSTVHVTELSGTVCGSGASINTGADPTFGSTAISSALSSPFTTSFAAGGNQNAADVSGLPDSCRGFINAAAPDYRVELSSGQPTLNIAACGDTDLTLIVNDAHGGWHCNDDAEGRNPVVTLSPPPQGRYDIWIGTYESGTMPQSTLKLSDRPGPFCN